MTRASSRRLAVVLFSNLFPTPTEPTRGVFNLQLAKALQEFCDVTVVCPLPWFPRHALFRRFARWYTFAGVPARYDVEGVRVESPKYPMIPRISGGIQARLVAAAARPVVARLLREGRCDVINAHWLYPDGVAAERIGSALDVTVVPAALGCDINRMMGEPDKRSQIAGMLQRSPRIVAVSGALTDRIVQIGVPRARVTTIPNGVDIDRFRPLSRTDCRQRLDIPACAKLILFVGRLSEEKGVDTLIDAMERICATGQPAQLTLVGDGPLRAALSERVDKSGLRERIRFAGSMPHAEVSRWMGACDVFCLPSLREGCPNVINEALASGRPVVASSVGGIPDMVAPHCGKLVPPADPQRLADALTWALATTWNADELAQSMANKSWRTAALRYFELLRESAGAPES
ncbi:MAG: glycosyltransferase family 4 protein [Betaproteobacteria bacterium]|nr:glycosyltransferase family 4 protein [Betaproteobacteria bacterium]